MIGYHVRRGRYGGNFKLENMRPDNVEDTYFTRRGNKHNVNITTETLCTTVDNDSRACAFQDKNGHNCIEQ